MGEWQPIETAPKDIDRAIVWGEHSLRQEFDENDASRDCYIANWFGETWGNFWEADGEGFINGVTHWMPLPDPPISDG